MHAAYALKYAEYALGYAEYAFVYAEYGLEYAEYASKHAEGESPLISLKSTVSVISCSIESIARFVNLSCPIEERKCIFINLGLGKLP